MAARYSGNVELRIRLTRMRGWNGRMGLFYVAQVYAPSYSGEGVLSTREAKVKGDPNTSEAYDRAAEAMLTYANKETHGFIAKHAVKHGRRWEVLRVQQSPCPLEEEL